MKIQIARPGLFAFLASMVVVSVPTVYSLEVDTTRPWLAMKLGNGTIDAAQPGFMRYPVSDAVTNTSVMYMSLDDDVQIGCTGHALDSGDVQTSVNDMCSTPQYCQQVGAYKGCDVSTGNAHVYMCTYTSYGQPCVKQELDTAIKAIFSVCGNDMSGWWFAGGPNKNYGVDAVAGVGWCCNLPTQGAQQGCTLNGPWGNKEGHRVM